MQKLQLFLTSLLFLLQGLQADIHIVKVSNNTYEPADVIILPGDSVRFEWVEGNHPTLFDNEDIPLFQMNSSNTEKTLVFETVGEFPYICTFHRNAGMAGTITVTDQAGIIPFSPLAGETRTLLTQNKLVIQYAGYLKEIEIVDAKGNHMLRSPNNPVNIETLASGYYFAVINGRVAIPFMVGSH